MYSQLSKMMKIWMLQKGKIVKLSKADILDFSINLYYIRKKISPEKYQQILELYKKMSKENNKVKMNLEQYNKIMDDMTKKFTAIAQIPLNSSKK